MSPAEVRAAGGVVYRGAGDDVEVVLIHRQRYDDWTLPKGKADPGESDEDCARREVREETGLSCRLGPELPTTRYNDSDGRPKVVRYWAMEPVSGSLRPTPPEVDEVRWTPLASAAAELSYDHDRQVVDALVNVLSK